SAIIGAFIGGTTMRGFTALVDPMAATMGWSYAQISLAMTFRGVESGVMNPFMGVVADRWPARRLVFIGITVIGLGVLFLSRVNSLPMFYLSFIIIGVGGSLGMQVVPMTVIARWFRRNSGKAYGIMAAGVGASGFLVPIVTMLIDTYGWRAYLVMVTVGVLVIGLPLSFVFRNRPEDYGLLVDGKPQDGLDNSHRLQTQDVSMGVKEALKTRAFWCIGMAFMLQIAGGSAVLLHIMPYLASLEIERSTASMIIMFISIVSIPSRFVFGWLSDIFRKSYLIAVSMVLTSIALYLFSIIDGSSFGLIIGFVIVYGFVVGAYISLMPPIIREYFGTKKFGTIFGLTSIFITIGAITAPPLAGWVFDTRGVYDPVWLIFSGVCVLGAILMLTIPQASKSLKPATS
ncbi:MAG TPA: MFS transporter, partial [Dehalococcoidia bacterium]|nr:MFS transporter [Dehalococcoidia bacterium]